MKVKKRNGSFEEVKLDKITRSVTKSCEGLEYVEPSKIAFKTVGAIFDGISTRQLDELSISTAVNFIIEDPNYSKVAARLLSNFIHKEVENHEVYSFSQSIQLGLEQGLISDQTFSFVMDNKRKLNGAIKRENDFLFEYYGIKTIYDRYLLKHPIDRTIIETPQYFLMRVACGLSKNAKEAVDFYNLLSSLEYMTSTPTLFNSGTTHSQMSSCYLLDSPMDDLKDLYKRYQDIAMLSKWAGGIGVSMSRIRSSGSLIRGTNGKSNGIIPWIHTLDSSVAAVNQCLLPTERVLTVDGHIEISKIREYDMIKTTNGFDFVDEIMVGDYVGEIIEIETEDGLLKVTPEHPILVIENGGTFPKNELIRLINDRLIEPKWISAQNIKTTDIIISENMKEIFEIKNI